MTDPLYDAMIQRAGDLAHYMLRHDMPIALASGTTPNGHPCTVIIAIGEQAGEAEQVGNALMEDIARRIALRSMRAKLN